MSATDQLVRMSCRYKATWIELDDDLMKSNYYGLKNIERREQVAEINRTIQKLNKSDQKIIHLMIFEGNSLRLAGTAIGVSAMTVQRRLKRALATLRDRLTSDQSVWFEVLFICFSNVSIAAFNAESWRSTPSRHIESMACLRCWCWRFIPSISVEGLQQKGESMWLQELIKLDWFFYLMWALWRIGGCWCWY